MEHDKKKAQGFLADYEQGKHGFKMPIDEVIANLLRQYRVACDGTKTGKLGL